MNREEAEDFQRLIEEADAAQARNFAHFMAGVFVGILLTIAWGMLPC